MENKQALPQHIGIIMDGNGRWATKKGLPRTMGHKHAVGTIKELCNHMIDLGIPYCSLYAFSTENFKREQQEVDYLMDLFLSIFEKEFSFLKERNAKVLFSGRREPLSDKVLHAMDTLMEETKNNDGFVLNICLNYGSHAEVIDTTKKLCEAYQEGKITLDEITEEYFQEHLYQNLPPLDFVIRTSGEYRLSNFMMYQASYAEFYFPKVLFPDFSKEELDKALLEFQNRNRRFGGSE